MPRPSSVLAPIDRSVDDGDLAGTGQATLDGDGSCRAACAQDHYILAGRVHLGLVLQGGKESLASGVFSDQAAVLTPDGIHGTNQLGVWAVFVRILKDRHSVWNRQIDAAHIGSP
jgi:hypothetical protein